MADEDILQLVKARSSPGVLILGMNNKVLYSNREAVNLLSDSNVATPEVAHLCEQVKSDGPSSGICTLLWRPDGTVYSIRAFLLCEPGNTPDGTHVMVLVEKVAEQHGIDLKKARNRFGLSDREIDVVALVAEGFSNKDIACQLFISEHTVKDHLKNISRKMQAASRSEIIAMLK